MEFTEITEEVEHNLLPETTSATQCEECGAPVDRLQRYCVSCGARRLSVADPAATYLAQARASARSHTRSRPTSGGRRTGVSKRSPVSGTIALLALIAILVAIGVGVLIGHDTASSGGTAPKSSSVSTSSTAGKQGKSATSAVDNATGKAYLKKALSGPSSVSVP
jgi:hypothetical protein